MASSATPLRVLLLECPSKNETIASLLVDSACALHVARTPAAALASVEQFAPHVVIVDITDSEVKGALKLAQALRSFAGTKNARVALVAVSDRASPIDRRLDTLYDLHLVKPLKPRMVRLVVRVFGWLIRHMTSRNRVRRKKILQPRGEVTGESQSQK